MVEYELGKEERYEWGFVKVNVSRKILNIRNYLSYL